MLAIYLGGAPTRHRGRSWSASSCCSRHLSSGYADPGRPGWNAGQAPASLAAASPGEAVRAWGRLGYPRRALRLHQAARMITDDFNGQVPKDRDSLLRLPGVGSYTAAAIGSFAYGRREIVLDTNVRRVIARVAIRRRVPLCHTNNLGTSFRRAARTAYAASRRTLGRCLDGARRSGVPRSQSALRCLPRSRSVCLAAGRSSGLGGSTETRSGVHGDRSAVPRFPTRRTQVQRRPD